MLGGQSQEAELAPQFEAWGASLPEQFKDDYVPWPELFPVLTLFGSVLTQWRMAPSGKVYGLDYEAVRGVARDLDIKLDQQMWSDIQVLEDAAAVELNGD